MIQDELKYRILQALEFEPTAEQERALEVFARFMTDRAEHVVMILSRCEGVLALCGACCLYHPSSYLSAEISWRPEFIQPE